MEVEHSLPGETKLALPPRPAYLRSLDKLDTLQSAARLGVPAPRFHHWRAGTALPPDAELPAYPIVLKPRSSVVYHDNRLHFPRVSYAADRAELDKRAAGYGEHCDLLLQERVRGEGIGVELLRLPGGELHTVFQHRRVREMPLTGGGSTCRVAENVDAKLLAYAGSLLDDLDWTGVAMVEFKTGRAGDFLMEINGRFWGSLALAVDVGVDFPRLLAAMHLGETMPPRRLPGRHRSIKIPADLNWIAEVIQGPLPAARAEAPAAPCSPGRLRHALAAVVRWRHLERPTPRPGHAGRYLQAFPAEEVSMQLRAGIFHCHTDFSYDSRLTFADYRRWSATIGFQFVLLTEHSRGRSDAQYQEYRGQAIEASNERVRLIPGIEYETRERHELIAVNARALPDEPLSLAEAVEFFRLRADLLVLPHPSRRKLEVCLPDLAPRMNLIDGVESRT